MTATLAPTAEAVGDRLAGSPLLVMLDVDGTLAPIAPRPQDAVVPAHTRRVIAALATRAGVHVVLVSGRAAADARRMVSVSNAWTIGNHGYEIVGPNGEDVVDPQVAGYRAVIAHAARRLAPQLALVRGVILEDKGWTLSIHYRLAEDSVVPRLRSVVEETVRQLGLRLTMGKLVFEVRPPTRVDKGTTAVMLGLRLGGFASESSVLYAGDDATDEDAFRALRARSARAVTICVTHGERRSTAAEFALRDPDEMHEFLEWLLSTRR